MNLGNPVIVLGTRNAKKREELEKLLAPLGFDVRTLADFHQAVEVEEDAKTFAANAQKKAVEQARALNAWVLGEDSGLVVDALEGRPGVFSARFAGPNASDSENNARLLELLVHAPPALRTAHYVCHASLADPSGEVRADVEAICRGIIRHEPAGMAGFGYDPVFEIVEYHRTFGELGTRVKSVISHRARAMRQLTRQIERLLMQGAWTAAGV